MANRRICGPAAWMRGSSPRMTVIPEAERSEAVRNPQITWPQIRARIPGSRAFARDSE